MLYGVFSIYDSAIKAWLPPIYAKNKGDMLRQFSDAVNNKDSILAKHPSDYALYEVGTWDDDKCLFDLQKQPVRLGLALEFVKVLPSHLGGLGENPPERSVATVALPVGS